MANGMSFEKLRDDYLLVKGTFSQRMSDLGKRVDKLEEDMDKLRDSLEQKFDGIRKMLLTVLLGLLAQITVGLLMLAHK